MWCVPFSSQTLLASSASPNGSWICVRQLPCYHSVCLCRTNALCWCFRSAVSRREVSVADVIVIRCFVCRKMGKKDGKPRGKMSANAYFVQTCRDELKKKNPNETVVFAEFSKKCGEKWKVVCISKIFVILCD